MKSLFLMALILSAQTLSARVPEIESLFVRLSQDNRELELSKLNSEFKYQAVRGSKARLWPNLTLQTTLSKGLINKEKATQNSSASTGVSSPVGSLGSHNDSVSDVSQLNDGWSAQGSMGYFIFTQFAVSEEIKRSENDLKAAKLSESEAFDEKKSRLLQLLLEWQLLHQAYSPLQEAQKMINQVMRFSKGKSKVLYTSRDRAKLNEKKTEIDYQYIRVAEGRSLVAAGLRDLIPSMTDIEISRLPLIKVDYPLPENERIRRMYVRQSRGRKKQSLDVENAKGYRKVTEWDRPWIPTVYSSLSYTYSGDYKGETDDGGLSGSLMFKFNIFDGFYADAKRQQARIGVRASEAKLEVETDKKVLYLRYQRMKAMVAKAEYIHKTAIAAKKRDRLRDIQRKFRQGVGSRLEVTTGTLEFVKAQMEALKAKKDYQSASLGMAVELNEWNKVTVNEISR